MEEKEILEQLIKVADYFDEEGFEDEAADLDCIMSRFAAKKKKTKDGWPKKLKKGRFGEWCKRNGFKGACKSCADKAMKSDDASVRGMASFYLNTVKP